MRTPAPLAAALTAAFLATAATAQDVRVSAVFDVPEVRPDGTASYTLTLSGPDLPSPSALPRPDFSAFEFLGGPAQGSSTQVSLQNGRMEARRTLTYTWRLSPAGGREGELTVPSFSLQVGAQRVVVPAASVTSTMRAAAPPARSRGSTGLSEPWDPFATPRERRAAEPQDGHLEVVAELDESVVWLGQEVILTHVVQFSPETVVRRFDPAPAEFPGFEKQAREVQHQARRAPGRAWQEVPLAQWRLVPLTFGDRELGPQAYTLHVQNRSRDFFDGFFGGGEQRIRRTTEPLSLRVQPLPPGAPSTFTGAVGSFQLEGSLGATELKQGDGTTLRLVVKGTGNFGPVRAPQLELPAGVRSFDPEVREDTRPGRDGRTTGAKIFEYPLLLEAAGSFEIPPVEWSFFDPKSGRYVSRRSRAFNLVVEPSESPTPELSASAGSRVVETLDTDIHHVVASWNPAMATSSDSGIPPWFWPLLALGPILPLAALAWRLRERFTRRDPARGRQRRAGQEARSKLSAAVAAAKAGRTLEAADGASEAVGRFVVARLGGAGAAPVPVEVERLVAAAGCPDLAARVRRHLEACDFLRFAGASAPPGRAAELAEQARALVGELEAALSTGRGRAA